MNQERSIDISPIIQQAALDPFISISKLKEICNICLHFNFSGLSTSLNKLKEARELIPKGSRTKLISVIAFPFGDIKEEHKLKEAEWAEINGADELELVPDYLSIIENKPDKYAQEIASICTIGLPVRVILNSQNIEKEKLSVAISAAIDAGASSLQIGNGFGEPILPERINQFIDLTSNKHEIKAVGGIRLLDQVIQLHDAGATKIGTSFGLQIMNELKRKKH
tara:strand:- start:2903 stop:3574 length:672 start_codon:yes stop_codon:yes gene_type:complete